MDNKIKPEYLGSKFINGEYYDKKTAKFYELKDNDKSTYPNKITSLTNDITKLTVENTNYVSCALA